MANTKRNGETSGGAGASSDDDQPVLKEDPRARPLTPFELARNANIRHEGERAAIAEQERAARRVGTIQAVEEFDEDGKPRMRGVERKAGKETTEFVETPFSISHHPDGTEKKMVICRPDGKGEREVTVAEWDRIQANPNLAPGAWMIKFTEVIAPDHSDNA